MEVRTAPRTILITGSASGVGEATRRRLGELDYSVLGVNVLDADIKADLGTEQGRPAMLEWA